MRSIAELIIVGALVLFAFPSFSECRSNGGEIFPCLLVGMAMGYAKWILFFLASIFDGLMHLFSVKH